MTRFTPAARCWYALVAVAALAVTIATLRQPMVARTDWGALVVLALCAGIAHYFPVRSGADGAYRLTNVFLIAGALILPLPVLAPLAILALTPDALGEQRGVQRGLRWLAGVPPAILALQATGYWLQWSGVAAIRSVPDLAVALAASVIFSLLQNLLTGLGMALTLRLPLHRIDPLAPAALLSDGLFAILGVSVAGLWLAAPVFLLLVLPVLVTTHRLTRTAHLAQLAQVDTKTGLRNARSFEQVLAREVARSIRLHRPLALIFADLDHFKRVNDEHGHATGDRVLQEFGARFAGLLRSGDVVARFGGEEFVALLPDTDAEEAIYLAEVVREAIAERPFPLPQGGDLRCTASLGVAVCPEDGQTVETLLQQADLAMYRAKRTRNAVARISPLHAVPRLPLPVAVALSPAVPVHAGNRWATWSLTALNLLGALALAGGLVTTTWLHAWRPVIPLVLLAAAAELLTVRVLESQRQRLTVSFTIVAVLAAAMIAPASAPLVAFAAALAYALRQRHWRRGSERLVLGLTGPALAGGIAGGAAFLRPGSADPLSAPALAATAGVVLLYYGATLVGVALATAAHTGHSPAARLRDALAMAPVALPLGFAGAFLGLVQTQVGPLAVAVCVVPLLAMQLTLAHSARRYRLVLTSAQAGRLEVEQAHEEKEQTLRDFIATVGAIVDAREGAAAGHSARVARYAVAIGEALGCTPRELAYLHTAGQLHDLGKIAVPEAILHDPGRLTDREFAIVKEHATLGEGLLAEISLLPEVARMVGDHHERFDGSGYPRGVRGEESELGGRILAVADALDAILSDRPHAAGKPLAWALEELDRCAGTHFDPAVVAAVHRVHITRGAAFFQAGDVGEVGRRAGRLIPFPGTATTPAAPDSERLLRDGTGQGR